MRGNMHRCESELTNHTITGFINCTYITRRWFETFVVNLVLFSR